MKRTIRGSVPGRALCVSTMLSLLALPAATASANYLHYIPLENDPVYGPRIIDVTGSEDPLLEWIIESGENDPQFFGRNGTEVEFTRPPSAPISDTNAVFDAPLFEDVTNARVTAFFEFEVSALASTALESLEIGFSDLVSSITWNEALQTIRADADAHVASGTPRWDTLSTFPYRIRFYYHFVDFVFTAVFVDGVGTVSAATSWKADSSNPFQNFFGAIEGPDPVNLNIYPFVSCQVDCTITALEQGVLECDTDGDHVDIDSCSVLPGVGNGVIDPGESCDDGNVLPGDGCDENGQLEEIGWKCQQAIGEAGRTYSRVRLHSLQKCRDRLNRGATLYRDQARSEAIVDRTECPLELGTSRRLVKAAARASRLVSARCTDALVGALGACGRTVDEILSSDGEAGCLLDTHDAAVAALLAAQYGS